MKNLFEEINTEHNLLPFDGECFYFPDFFSSDECDTLFNSLHQHIEWQQDQIFLYGKWHFIPRFSAFYGNPDITYSYSGIHLMAKPWNNELLMIKKRIEEKSGESFNAVLLNLYRTGNDSMGWHSDDEKELGINPVIGSVSFGSSRVFQLRHLKNKHRISVPLTNGSFLLMKGKTQHYWEHCIPKTKKIIGSRINLTFRLIH
jgi:alkylated DNA repair dioxygenase AlkB